VSKTKQSRELLELRGQTYTRVKPSKKDKDRDRTALRREMMDQLKNVRRYGYE